MEIGWEGRRVLKIMNYTRQTTKSVALLCYKLEKIA